MPTKKTRKPQLQPEHLTLYEKLYLRRMRKGLTKREAAIDLGMSTKKYGKLERGEITTGIPYMTIGRVLLHESHMIMRIRVGMSRQKLASKMDPPSTSHLVREMELGYRNEYPLTNYWLIRDAE